MMCCTAWFQTSELLPCFRESNECRVAFPQVEKQNFVGSIKKGDNAFLVQQKKMELKKERDGNKLHMSL